MEQQERDELRVHDLGEAATGSRRAVNLGFWGTHTTLGGVCGRGGILYHLGHPLGGGWGDLSAAKKTSFRKHFAERLRACS